MPDQDSVCRHFAGWDHGNHDSTLTERDEKGEIHEITMPSAIIEYNAEEEQNNELSNQQLEIEERLVFSMGDDPKQYLLGYSAIERASDSLGTGDRSRQLNTRNVMLFCAAACQLMREEERESQWYIVTGLPVDVYDEIEVKRLQQFLNGTYHCTLNEIQRTIHIKVLHVMMEGAGANAYLGTSDGNKRVGIIDGGGSSLDLATYKGQKLVKSKGKRIGIENAMQGLSNRIKREYKRHLSTLERYEIFRAHISTTYIDEYIEAEMRRLLEGKKLQTVKSVTPLAFVRRIADAHYSQEELDVILRQHIPFANILPFKTLVRQVEQGKVKRPYRHYGAFGRPIEYDHIFTWTELSIRETGGEMGEFVSQQWTHPDGVAADYDQIIFVGGAAYYVKNDIEKVIAILTIPEKPESANARGYESWARNIAKKFGLLVPKKTISA